MSAGKCIMREKKDDVEKKNIKSCAENSTRRN
jgi:hypothetical protein